MKTITNRDDFVDLLYCKIFIVWKININGGARNRWFMPGFLGIGRGRRCF